MKKIVSVNKGSLASRLGIKKGDSLISVNDNKINDVLDYLYYTAEENLTFNLSDKNGNLKTVSFVNDYSDIGINFEDSLMDKEKSCHNKCIFCFIDQLPRGMRKSLYYKDDDVRLSFLKGNYVTLTNLSDEDIERVIKLKVSPINISVHATDGELRAMMMGNKKAKNIKKLLYDFASAGIEMNCQIVVCKGVNDGEKLKETLSDLYKLYPSVHSVSVVPAGLTKHRKGLYNIDPIEKEDAENIIAITEKFAQQSRLCNDYGFCYCSDELYLKAGKPMPLYESYDDFAQFQNGVGSTAVFENEFYSALGSNTKKVKKETVSVVTGVSGAPAIVRAVKEFTEKYPGKTVNVYPIVNEFFGETITVTGLVTGGDIIKQLSGKNLGKRVIISDIMLRYDNKIFLDDITPKQLEKALKTKIVFTDSSGNGLFDALVR